MLEIRRDEEIFATDGGWFSARWHFSFDQYRDPEQVGVGPLRVFNDDRIVAGAEWPMHPHRDIESLTYVVEGEFEHADSLGNGGRLEAGAAQVMSFSHEGAHHSEKNGSDTRPMRFIQFWILPGSEGLDSSVQQRQYSKQERAEGWHQIMGPPGEAGLDLSSDARVQIAGPEAGAALEYRWVDGRGGYVYVIEGAGSFDDTEVSAGDAGEVEGPHTLTVATTAPTELILVDVPLHFTPVGVWAGER